MKKFLKILLIIVLGIIVIAAVWTFCLYMRSFRDTSVYYNISNETTTFNTIFYEDSDPSCVVYNAYDGNGEQPAKELMNVLSQGQYLPLNEAEGRKIIKEENKDTFVVRVFDRSSYKNRDYEIYNFRCISVNDRLYLILAGNAKRNLINPADSQTDGRPRMIDIVSVYECQGTKETRDKTMQYKKTVTDDEYHTYRMDGFYVMKLSIEFHFKVYLIEDLGKAIFIAITALISVLFLIFFIKKFKSNAKHTNDESTDDQAEEDCNAETEAAEERVRREGKNEDEADAASDDP